ncbi:hypothetical protein RXV86_02460 [Alisedimentitalea sp. MJ-SS2]|nr:hypothetical protein [Alisedimentitalea sp. MJ-SS2]
MNNLRLALVGDTPENTTQLSTEMARVEFDDGQTLAYTKHARDMRLGR